jgi:hypothetical protein
MDSIIGNEISKEACLKPSHGSHLYFYFSEYPEKNKANAIVRSGRTINAG